MTNASSWTDPRTGRRLTDSAALDRLATASVVLLGERHDSLDDHRWQARVIEGLAARRRPVLVGLEMFPRRVDSVLAAFAAGRIDRDRMLRDTGWREVWGFDPALYAPIFETCRRLGLPMRGLNIPRPLVSVIGRDGWEATPAEDRAWLSPAAAASPAYRRYLFEMTGGARPDRAAQHPQDPSFDRFVRAQGAWDRSFACALAAALAERPGALAIGVIGRGHLEYGYGTPAQLVDLGVGPVLVALPGGPPGPEVGPEPIADLVHDPRTD